MGTNVLVVGCGELGRRHIQGIVKSVNKPVVYVIDNDPKAIALLKSFLVNNLERSRYPAIKVIDFLKKDLVSLPVFDLVIVATTALARGELLGNLSPFIRTKHWLIEKPIGQSSAEIKSIAKWASDRSAFVNHPRRMMSWYQSISNNFIDTGPIKLTALYPKFGIACNTSHLIDLINWWTEAIPASVSVDGLNENWNRSKRKGFWDIEGLLKIKFSDGSAIELQSNKEVKKSVLEIEFAGTKRCIIEEDLGIARFSSGEVIMGNMQYQSEISGMLLDQLYETGKCDLPSLNIMAVCNELFVERLLQHWNSRTNGKKLYSLPST